MTGGSARVRFLLVLIVVVGLAFVAVGLEDGVLLLDATALPVGRVRLGFDLDDIF